MTDVLVLGYHAVSPDWRWKFSVTPERLEEQVRTLLRLGYRPATFHEATTAPQGPRVFALTFDDAFRSVVRVAFPILRRLDVPATIFAVTDFVGTDRPLAFGALSCYLDSPDEHELRAATWAELEQVVDAGWEVGAHTRTHRALTQLADAELDDELRGSRAACEERLGRPCPSLAYPFGDYDARVREAARRAGFASAALFPPLFAADPPHAWPRVGVYHGDGPGTFRLKVSPAARRLRGSRAWPAARGLLRTLRPAAAR